MDLEVAQLLLHRGPIYGNGFLGEAQLAGKEADKPFNVAFQRDSFVEANLSEFRVFCPFRGRNLTWLMKDTDEGCGNVL